MALPTLAAAAPPGSNWLERVLVDLGVSVGTANEVSDLVLRPLEILVVVAVAVVVAYFGARAIERVLNRTVSRAADRMDSPRAKARAHTLVALAANLFRAFVAVVTVFIVFGIVGIDLTPLLASATVIGATIGFGAQTLVRDYLSGFLLTMEDQFGIGDTVTVNGTTGVIEDLSLRVTRMRAFDGTVWFVPNGDIRMVANASRGWARAVIEVELAPERIDRLEEVKELLAEAATQVAHTARFAASCTEPAEVLGLVDADGTSLRLRVALRTSAALKVPLERALREGVLRSLQDAGVWPPEATPPEEPG
jgi:moderate conductance mechanosensitive channel